MWLPPEPPPADLSGLAPWQPPALREPLGPGFAYIVVDELHEGIAGLVVSPWPRVDERGRLHFGDEADSARVATPSAALLALLRDERTPIVPGGVDEAQERALQARGVAIGDVFAARLRGTPGGRDPSAWLEPPILDLTAPAREQAKVQASATASGAPSADYLQLVGEEMSEDV